MALTIVRNDITKMQVDAIVNTTNEYFEVGGHGVDAGIHYAAGPRLKEALAEIGYCPVGSAVITEAFDITNCRYIIHTVGPVYWDGRTGERDKLASCYRSILSLAREHGCRSLAIPSISTGAYRYPKAEAYSVATSCIREFLLSLPEDEDMMVYLVLFDQESVAVSEKIDSGVEHFISDAYTHEKKAELHSYYHPNSPARRREREDRTDRDEMLQHPSFNIRPKREKLKKEELVFEEASVMAAPTISGLSAGLPNITGAAAPAPGEAYKDEDRGFADMCDWWVSAKGMTKKEFYVRANINKGMFWAMKHNTEAIPKKTNALACVIGLKLDYDQAIDLLGRAGMTLSRYYETDRIVERHILEKKYNIDDINLELFDKDLTPLGSF